MFGSGLKWEEFVSAPGRFRILMPGKPEQYRNPGNDEMTETWMFQVNVKRAGFLAAFHDRILPEERPLAPDEIERIKNRMLSDISRGPVRYDDLLLGRCPGFHIEVASDKGTFATRVYFVSRRIYQLGVNAEQNFKEADKLKFFESFVLTA
jgi:hypothetical protein